MHTRLKKSATAEPSKNAAPGGMFKYRCLGCGGSWTAHGALVECHKCGGKSLEKSRRPDREETLANLRAQTAALQARQSGPWKCLSCEHIWFVNGVVRNCPMPDCGGDEVEPIEGKRCVTCNLWYEADELTCPGCGTVMFSRLDFALPPDRAPAALEAAARHLGGDIVDPPSPTSSPAAGGEVLVQIALQEIDPHPDNPRKHFDPASLAELAQGFKGVGVINPLTVRRVAGRYQLVAGERRWRAAKLARLATVPCRIVDITDEEAYEVMIRENLDRQDLDEIEKARSYKLGLEKCGLTQAAFAARYKKSQEHVSNTIRLLALPEAWQQRLIRREITATHARELLVWIDVPGLVARLDEVFRDDDREHEIESARAFRDTVLACVRGLSRTINPTDHEEHRCLFRPSAAQLAELDVREVHKMWGGSQKRAFNLAKWEEFNAAAKKRLAAAKSKQPQPDAAARDDSRDDGGLARQRVGRRLYLEKANTLAAAIGERLNVKKHAQLALGLLPVLIHYDCGKMAEAVDEVFAIGEGSDATAALLKAAIAMTRARFDAFAVDLLRRVVCTASEHEWDPPGPATVLDLLAETFKIDLAEHWQVTGEFLDLFQGADRAALLAQLPVQPARTKGAWGSTDCFKAVLDVWPTGFVPRELELVDHRGDIPSARQARQARKAKAKR